MGGASTHLSKATNARLRGSVLKYRPTICTSPQVCGAPGTLMNRVSGSAVMVLLTATSSSSCCPGSTSDTGTPPLTIGSSASPRTVGGRCAITKVPAKEELPEAWVAFGPASALNIGTTTRCRTLSTIQVMAQQPVGR